MERDKAMKDSLQKLQEETAKVEKSESFQAVRSGFQTAKVTFLKDCLNILMDVLYHSPKQVLLQLEER